MAVPSDLDPDGPRRPQSSAFMAGGLTLAGYLRACAEAGSLEGVEAGREDVIRRAARRAGVI